MRNSPLLIILARAPKMGTAKTRLARGVGRAEASRFYRATLARLMRRLSADRRWETLIALTPDPRGIAPRAPIIGQGGGDLGDRMARLMRRYSARALIIIGSDAPDINIRHIAQALRSLQNCHAVFGPAYDGGFYLIGMRPLFRPQRMFRDVRWSSQYALRDTARSLGSPVLSPKIATLPKLRDIDTAQDYRRWRSSAKLQGA